MLGHHYHNYNFVCMCLLCGPTLRKPLVLAAIVAGPRHLLAVGIAQALDYHHKKQLSCSFVDPPSNVSDEVQHGKSHQVGNTFFLVCTKQDCEFGEFL